MSARVPEPVAGVDVYALPLSTTEGFVLSRIDGSSRVEDISMMTGVPEKDLDGILERLAGLGAVRLPWKPQPTPQVTRPAKAVGSAPKPPPADESAAAALYDEVEANYELSELDGDAGIGLSTRRRILNAYHSVRERNLYEVLGVPQDAEKKVIRAAYFSLSKVFHADAFFGEDLGPYAGKLDAVFQRLTEAYETLGRKKRRQAYDQYLETTMATQKATASLAQAQQKAEQLRTATVDEISSEPEIPSATSLRPPKVPSIGNSARARKRAASKPIDRRKRMAERLRRQFDSAAPPPMRRSSTPPSGRPSSRPTSAPPASEPPRSATERRDSVIKDLARTIKSTAANMDPKQVKADRYLQAAILSEKKGEVLAAANALQLALALTPNDAALQVVYERVQSKLAAVLAENYEKQARYEEEVGKWAEAAKSWGQVVEARPDSVESHRRAAVALLRAHGDLHAARKYAEAAVQMRPKAVQNIVVLAEVFLAAGLKLNARRELEKAIKLSPRDEHVKNLLEGLN